MERQQIYTRCRDILRIHSAADDVGERVIRVNNQKDLVYTIQNYIQRVKRDGLM